MLPHIPQMSLTSRRQGRALNPRQGRDAQGGRDGGPQPRAERISAGPTVPVQSLSPRQRRIALARPELLPYWRVVVPPGYETIRAFQAPAAGTPQRVRVLWLKGTAVAVGVERGWYHRVLRDVLRINGAGWILFRWLVEAAAPPICGWLLADQRVGSIPASEPLPPRRA